MYFFHGDTFVYLVFIHKCACILYSEITVDKETHTTAHVSRSKFKNSHLPDVLTLKILLSCYSKIKCPLALLLIIDYFQKWKDM